MIKGEMTIQAVKGHYVQALDSPLQRIDTDYLSSVIINQTAGEDDFAFVVC